jgi:hypothetical protein
VPYPTVAGLAQETAMRRDTAEHLVRQKILELELKLLEAENGIIQEKLEQALGSILTQLPGVTARNFLALDTKSGPWSVPTALYHKLAGTSDYQLNLHPPEEDTQDVLEALDAAAALEEVKRKADDDDFVAVKQHLLNAEKIRIQ